MVGLWKQIRKEAPSLFSRCSFVVSNGALISFWNDKWSGDLPLRLVFLSLFENVRLKNTMLEDFWKDGY